MMAPKLFSLDSAFLEDYSKKTPPFGFNGLGELVYRRTYSRLLEDGTNEAWWQTCQRVVEGCYRMQQRHIQAHRLAWDTKKAQRSAQEMYRRMFDMKFLPPGRGLWAMGTPLTEERGLHAALFNCFAGDTEFITTDKGVVTFADTVGQTVHVINRYGKSVPVQVNSFGVQNTQYVSFKPRLVQQGLRTNLIRQVRVTPDHSWILQDGSTTTALKVGDVVLGATTAIDTTSEEYQAGRRHGVYFGDGTQNKQYPKRFMIRLCGAKRKLLSVLEAHPGYVSTVSSPTHHGDPFVTVLSDTNLKALPNNPSPNYAAGFIDGWHETDGANSKPLDHFAIDTQNSLAAEWLLTHAALGGYIVTGHNISNRPTNYGTRKNPLERITYTRKDTLFTVVEIVKTAPTEVFCVTEPQTHSFVLAGGMLTGNCSFVSTELIQTELAEPFAFLMDASMLGIGVGFDTKGADKLLIHTPTEEFSAFVIPDTREGWVISLELLLTSYFVANTPTISFDYDDIRAEGTPIKGFGGVASGAGPLRVMHEHIRKVLDDHRGRQLSVTGIVDIMNLIGKCVVAGNVRRTALISFGENTQEYLDLKNPKVNPERNHPTEGWGWTSNNSVAATLGMDYSDSAHRVAINGEPGYLWLENIHSYGRMKDKPTTSDSKVRGSNPCVTGDTLILTDQGHLPIEMLVDTPVKVWNGQEFSEVTPRVTGRNQPTLKVTFSNGQTLQCTPYHRFEVQHGFAQNGTTEIVEAQHLVHGMRLVKYQVPVIPGTEYVSEAYTQGFHAGDGMNGYSHVQVYPNKAMCVTRMEGTLHARSGVYDAFYPTAVLADKTFVPPVEWDVQSRLAWFAGLADSDGTICTDGQLQISSVNQEFLLDTQLMLQTLGVLSKCSKSHEARQKYMPNGRGGETLYDCQPCYRLMLGAQQVQDLVKLGFSCERLDVSHIPQRDATRYVSVVAVDQAEVVDKVFCFTEPLRGMGIFNGVLTAQCGEIPLESMELCNLTECFPARHDSLEDFQRTLKYAYLYSKTVTLSTTPWPKTNKVMLRNRRIGLSMSGIQQFVALHGLETFREWCEVGYATVKDYDQLYSDWLAIPRSKRLTTVKPSGSVSLLAGATPGLHWPESVTYIRRMRLASNSPLTKAFKKAGYVVEPAASDPHSVVVEVPVKLEEPGLRTLAEVPMWEQLAMAAFMQTHWSDNMVSCTITFDPETEGSHIESALDYYQYQLKGISFLPRLPQGAYLQMPYEAISEAEYQTRSAALKPLKIGVTHEEAEAERFCNNDVCTII